jgi:Skp family chaperone for outer membrane proteins
MNTLGKTLTILIAIACLCLMIGSMFVYATHTNWSAKYTALKQQFDQAKVAASELESKYLGEVSQLKSEQEAAQQEVRKLESERVALVSQNSTIQKEVDQLRTERQAAEAMVAATEENNIRLTEEVVKLRDSLRENQQFRDEAFTATLRASTDLHVASGDLAQAKERNEQLVGQLAEKISALREGGVDPNGKVVPRVRGKVSATRRVDGSQLIEITVGADDGISPGQMVEIFRGDRYLGRAEILKADPDRAVGRIIRQYQQGQIQEDDDVATKLRVG